MALELLRVFSPWLGDPDVPKMDVEFAETGYGADGELLEVSTPETILLGTPLLVTGEVPVDTDGLFTG